ncbi:MAG: hypothetical protein WC657_03825 [Candidatus Paceibacterota bacterium]|jgi:DNA-binding TFAR19-related protein (PDSD5 family)
MNTQEKLEQLERINEYLDTFESRKSDTRSALDGEKQSLIDSILTPEILAKVEEIKAEFQPKYDSLENDQAYLAQKAEAESLIAEIKSDVIAEGKTIKGSRLMAVYAKGRISWDNKGLDGYIVAHPELAQFRKEGEPSVSIRKI